MSAILRRGDVPVERGSLSPARGLAADVAGVIRRDMTSFRADALRGAENRRPLQHRASIGELLAPDRDYREPALKRPVAGNGDAET
jgi:hypothetical protein